MADGAFPLAPAAGPHRLVEARPCKLCNGPCAPGLAFLRQLAQALETAKGLGTLSEEFEISGQAQLRCGDRLCPMLWQAGHDFCRLQGDAPGDTAVLLETRALVLN
ncbi:hypothetical protein [Rhodobacter maris]|uniref:Uncharacterized protein n=1 Tax=Rhodobacter maris TaxID=446682 RepID=A0A285RHT8_9RHOB|nr:hypothetical protein [Rhodobacter maris]SOB93676.1 hypothetical protein SAMN05877831_101223 [Rhodobacter maris]